MKNKMRKSGFVKSTILNWLGFGLTDVAQWSNYYGVESNAGVTINEQKAYGLSAYVACVRLISQTIATLPLGIYKDGDNGRVEVKNDPRYRILGQRPNADMTAKTFWECMLSSAMTSGNGFAEKLMIGDRLVGLEFLPHTRVTWRELSTGELIFTYVDCHGRRRDIPRNMIFHLPGFATCGRFGMSVIQYGREVLGASVAANDAANSTFKNGLMPTTFFKFPNWLTPKQRDEFKDNVEGIKGSLNAGKQPLLEGGMDVGAVGINPQDAQLLQSRAFNIEEICRWFGVPPSMIGQTDKASSWASSAESLNLWFLQYALRPWLKGIEQAIWFDLFSPAEQADLYAEFGVEGLLRADTAGRTSFYSTALQNGWMSRDEVRKLENFGPIPGGDVFTAQSNLVQLLSLDVSKDTSASDTPDAIDNAVVTSGAADVQQTALNGAQVTALQEIVLAVTAGNLPIASAAGLIAAAFPLLSQSDIDAILNPLTGFKPVAQEPVNGTQGF